MKKLLIALLVIILIVVVALFVFAGKMDGIIKDTIETEGTAALGSQVTLESVVTDLKAGSALLTQLTIANPPGYTAPNAVELTSFSASVDYRNQVIDDIDINNPIINAEQKGTKNNFQDLLNNMPSDETQEAESEADDTVLTINRLALRQATVNLITSDLAIAGKAIDFGTKSFTMDDFVLTGLTGTATEISDVIVSKLTAHVSQQVQSYVKKELGEIAKARLMQEAKDKMNEKLSGALGDKLNIELDANLDGESGEKLKENLNDKLKGFGFGKKK